MKVTLLQLNYLVGDTQYNTNKIINHIQKIDQNEKQLIVGSELAITGYPPLDLVYRPWVLDEQKAAIEKIIDAIKLYAPQSKIIIGCVGQTDYGKGLTNSLVVLGANGIELSVDKVLLPTYDIFNERSYFEAGDLTQNRIVDFCGKKIALFICEDMWNQEGCWYGGIDPVAETLDNNSVDMIVSINASPNIIGKYAKRLKVYQQKCKKYQVPIVYVNQVGANDELIFDGNSFVLNSEGNIVGSAATYKEDCKEISFTDIADLNRGNSKQESNNDTDHISVIYNNIKLGIQDYIGKCRAKGALISVSGGIDSALVITAAVDALGSDNVKAFTQPSDFSSAGSIDYSRELCKNLGVEFSIVSIKDKVKVHCKQFNQRHQEPMQGLTLENLQARIRGVNMMEEANYLSGWLVLSCGNKSEMSVGYFTDYGDSVGALSPLADVYKTECYELADYYNNVIFDKTVIPQAIIKQAPSAELAPGQKDSDSLIPYPVLDQLLNIYLESKHLAKEEKLEIVKNLKALIKEYQIADSELLRMLRLVDRAEFKRRKAPLIIKCHSISFGNGRRLPVAMRSNLNKNVLKYLLNEEI